MSGGATPSSTARRTAAGELAHELERDPRAIRARRSRSMRSAPIARRTASRSCTAIDVVKKAEIGHIADVRQRRRAALLARRSTARAGVRGSACVVERGSRVPGHRNRAAPNDPVPRWSTKTMSRRLFDAPVAARSAPGASAIALCPGPPAKHEHRVAELVPGQRRHHDIENTRSPADCGHVPDRADAAALGRTARLLRRPATAAVRAGLAHVCTLGEASELWRPIRTAPANGLVHGARRVTQRRVRYQHQRLVCERPVHAGSPACDWRLDGNARVQAVVADRHSSHSAMRSAGAVALVSSRVGAAIAATAPSTRFNSPLLQPARRARSRRRPACPSRRPSERSASRSTSSMRIAAPPLAEIAAVFEVLVQGRAASSRRLAGLAARPGSAPCRPPAPGSTPRRGLHVVRRCRHEGSRRCSRIAGCRRDSSSTVRGMAELLGSGARHGAGHLCWCGDLIGAAAGCISRAPGPTARDRRAREPPLRTGRPWVLM